MTIYCFNFILHIINTVNERETLRAVSTESLFFPKTLGGIGQRRRFGDVFRSGKYNQSDPPQ